VSRREVNRWAVGEVTYWSSRVLRHEAWLLGLIEVEAFLADREFECEQRWAGRSYAATALLFAVSGYWHFKDRQRQRQPKRPPEGITAEQLALAKSRLERAGWTLVRNPRGEWWPVRVI
jgi:hypothetical protein